MSRAENDHEEKSRKNRILISSNDLHPSSISVSVVIIEPSITVKLNGNSFYTICYIPLHVPPLMNYTAVIPFYHS